MEFDYLYGDSIDDLLMYSVPKSLFSSPRFTGLSAEAKVLYGVLLEMVDQSADDGNVDETDRIYVLYSITEICRDFCCTSEKAAMMLKELEKFDLVSTLQERIYPKNYQTEGE